MQNSANQILSTKNLSVGYTSNVLFEGVDLELYPGKLTCFMGPNGIGKSTLIRTLAGLQRPLAGEILNQDEKKIAVVLTDKVTATHMTVYDLVGYGRYPHINWDVSFSSIDLEVIDQSIREVRIASLIDKKLEELSDGQLQLAMIARALAQETPVLLLDEPTAHLDLNNRVEIMKLLLKLAREKDKAIVVATHELDLALQMADDVWLATPDKKMVTGIPEDLVLDGSFDNVFKFKGFDLKTGKVQHQSFQKKTIHLQGEGYSFLWTKNALERQGFSVSTDGELTIWVYSDENRTAWKINDRSFFSIRDLLTDLVK
ncbi:MAG TPA: ABC transporter ATP-binding protein [Cyclobacteriaceae bacterium]|jgi:iron complex transport system ATP-binding protein|nr:ABC transporter ATP-binding protein [Cyclobacteriaceae bacterium]